MKKKFNTEEIRMQKIFTFSKYNVIAKNRDNYLLFNTKSLALSVIDCATKNMIEENDEEMLNSKSDAELKVFAKNGYIIDKTFDELGALKDHYWNTRFNQDTLYLSIMTTLNCNFKCSYCFEKRKNNVLTKENQEGVIQFIKKNCRKFKKVHVDWYGGEPLLGKNVISEMSEDIIDICKKENLIYDASITTNGYLLNNLSDNEYEKYKIKSLQVTLDGDEEVHNSRRILMNGEGTFTRIIENLRKVPQDIEINLRVNVDRDNVEKIENLLVRLGNEALTRCILSIKSVVSSNTNPCEDKILESELFTEKLLPLYRKAKAMGFRTVLFNPLMYFKNVFCIVDYEYQYIISPDGGVFKCGESYEEDDPSKIGYLNSNGKMDLDLAVVSNWTKDPFADEECRNCKYIPLCWGGCQLKRNVKKTSPCYTEYKNNFEDILRMYYEMKKEN